MCDLGINDCAYGSIGFIILDRSYECILCIFVAFVTEGPHGRIV